MHSGASLKRMTAMAALAAGIVITGAALAQERYPSRPIEFIVPWGPGGGADQVARKIGQLLEPGLKVSIPVINVAGATGQTGHAKLMAANADGYTMEVMTGDTFALLADRQIERLVNWRYSRGLPPLLAAGAPGLNTGFGGAQLLATSLAAEARLLGTPASIQTIPTNANNQDVVSMPVPE